MTTPRRGRRNISENVWLLQNTLAKILNDEDRTFFIHSLNKYQKDRDVLELVGSLKRVLDSPKKREVYPLLRELIPSNDKRYFERAWHANQPQHLHPSSQWNYSNSTRSRSRSPNRPQDRLRRYHIYSSLPENLDKCDSGVDLPNLKKSASSRSFQKYPIRRLYLKRAPGTGFGFCMRGGSEHGVGLYVSSVDENSVAEYEGMLPGDHILFVNEIRFDGLNHDQAVKVIKNNKKLNMVVRSVGRIPDTFVAEETYKWIDPMGQRVSPPPNVDSNGREMSTDGIHRSDLRLLGDDDERKVNVFIEDGDKLGLTIRGGSEYGLGIYIAGVDPNSAAQKAGLKCGDQIMDVNGISFLNISHADAVKVLKSAKNMMVTMKDVGRLPFAKTLTDRTRWAKGKLPNKQVPSDAESILTITAQVHEPPTLDNRRHTTAGSSRFETERSENSKFRHGIAGSQLLYNGTGPSTKSLAEEQAKQVLNENELGTMSYYMDEYSKGFITVDAFVLALFSLFNSPAKVSLLSEVRGSIHPKDIDRFDDLVLKKEIEAIKKRNVISPESHDDAHSIRSYSSSVSSFSEHGSSSSSSSTKESLDSRPITPPRVPEVMPTNMEVLRVQNDFGKSSKKQMYDDTENDGLPRILTNDDALDDSRKSMPSPPPDFTTILPLSSSSPRNPKHDRAVTNGEITKYLFTGDNTRIKDVPNKKHNSKKPHKHTKARDKSPKENSTKSSQDKEHAREKNDLQSSSDLSFNLISEPKKEKRGFFLPLNKLRGSYSPNKHDHSLAGKESTSLNGSSNLYNVTLVNNSSSNHNAESSPEQSFDNSGKKFENHVGTSSNSPSKPRSNGSISEDKIKHAKNNSDNIAEKYNDNILVVESEENISLTSPSKLNGHVISEKQSHGDGLSKPTDSSKDVSRLHEVDHRSSTSKAPFKPKPHHAKSEGKNNERDEVSASLEGNQNLNSQLKMNSAFAPPKPKPYIPITEVQATRTSAYKKDPESIKEDIHGKVVEKPSSVAPPKLYSHLEKSQVYKGDSSSRDVEGKEDDYVDIDSIRKAKQRSRQKKQVLEKDSEKHENEYVDPKLMDLFVKPPQKPPPYSSKSENKMVEKSEGNSPTAPPKSTLDSSSALEKGADKNNDLPQSIKSSIGIKTGSVAPPKPKVYDLARDDQVNGMYLAMEASPTNRSGLEKSTSWGEEIIDSLSSVFCDEASNLGKERTNGSPRESEEIGNVGKPEVENGVYSSRYEQNAIRKSNDKTIEVSERGNNNLLVDSRLNQESVIKTENIARNDTRSRQDIVTETESLTKGHIRSAEENLTKIDSVTRIPMEEDDATNTEGITKNHIRIVKEDVTNNESVTESHTMDTFRYDINQNMEELPKKQSVLNMIKAYNTMSDASLSKSANPGNNVFRKESGLNRKSWDGVGNPSNTEQDQKVSMVEKKRCLKSSSDSNLVNLPKDQKKSIQVKLRASQELLELRQQSRESSTNNSRRSSMDVSLPSEPASLSSKPMQSQHALGYEIEIEKTSEGLGLSLEGGSDTSSTNAPILVKHVKEGPYAAYMCGKLRPGQSILQINDKPVQGMTNAMAILTLRQAYSDTETKTLLLVVKDPK